MGQLEQIQKDIEALKDMQQAFLEAIQKLNGKEPEIVNIDDLIKYRPFLKSKSKVYSMINKRAIPYHKQGRNLLFKLSEVDEFLTSNKLKAV